MKPTMQELRLEYQNAYPNAPMDEGLLQDLIDLSHLKKTDLTPEFLNLIFLVNHDNPATALRLDSLLSWGKFEKETLYRKNEFRFPPNHYPFTHIAFDSHVNGAFTLSISATTFLSAPILQHAFRSVYLFRHTLNGVEFCFDPKSKWTFSPENVISLIQLFFKIIENELLSNAELLNSYTEAKSKIIECGRQYNLDFIDGFSGVKCIELLPPPKLDPRSKEVFALKLVLSNNTQALREELRNQLDPNLNVLGLTLFSTLIDEACFKVNIHKHQQTLIFAKLLLEFNADPTLIVQTSLLKVAKTTLEILIEHSYFKTDPLEQQIFIDLIMLLLHFDQNHSHLIVSSEYNNHPIGKTVIDGLKALKATKELPPRIKYIYPFRNMLVIVNELHEWVYLRSAVLKEFFRKDGDYDHKRKQAAQLYFDVFSKKVELKHENMEKDLQELMLPESQQHFNGSGHIDLLLDPNHNVIGYSTSQIDLPNNRDEPVKHVIPLAICNSFINKHFRRLMSLMMFWRTFSLHDRHLCDVLTSFNAVSASSYLQIAQLYAIPKYLNVVCDIDTTNLEKRFYSADLKDLTIERGMHYFKSHLFYTLEPNKDLGILAQINCESFNTNIAKPQHEVVAAFYLIAYANNEILSTLLSTGLVPELELPKVIKLFERLDILVPQRL